jgi:hypothetical protein
VLFSELLGAAWQELSHILQTLEMSREQRSQLCGSDLSGEMIYDSRNILLFAGLVGRYHCPVCAQQAEQA